MNKGNPDQQYRLQSGSIMLETVLAIPLFMILLGGIFWIGELMIARQKLVIADRYIAWNKGLRYPDKGPVDQGTIRRLYFSEPGGAALKNHNVTAASGKIEKTFDWSHAASGQAKLNLKMPDWTRFMFNTAQVMYNSGVPDEQAFSMQGRDKPDQSHVVVMRTEAEAKKSYIRNKYTVKGAGEVAGEWKKITDEKWPYE